MLIRLGMPKYNDEYQYQLKVARLQHRKINLLNCTNQHIKNCVF